MDPKVRTAVHAILIDELRKKGYAPNPADVVPFLDKMDAIMEAAEAGKDVSADLPPLHLGPVQPPEVDNALPEPGGPPEAGHDLPEKPDKPVHDLPEPGKPGQDLPSGPSGPNVPGQDLPEHGKPGHDLPEHGKPGHDLPGKPSVPQPKHK